MTPRGVIRIFSTITKSQPIIIVENLLDMHFSHFLNNNDSFSTIMYLADLRLLNNNRYRPQMALPSSVILLFSRDFYFGPNLLMCKLCELHYCRKNWKNMQIPQFSYKISERSKIAVSSTLANGLLMLNIRDFLFLYRYRPTAFEANNFERVESK